MIESAKHIYISLVSRRNEDTIYTLSLDIGDENLYKFKFFASELLSKIEWACTFSKTAPKIINGTLRIIKHTNLAYVEPHRVIINNKLYIYSSMNMIISI